jgi:hypothetical protein
MYRYVITLTRNGKTIYVNLINSSAGRYLNRQPYVITLIRDVLTPIKISGVRVAIERDMGRVIGNTDIVETNETDTIFYAQPQKKNFFSRYAKNRFPAPSHKLTVILEKDTQGDYEIIDTWIGPCSPPFPGDVNETVKSRSYWENHALVLDIQAVQPKTLTKDCPY